MPSDLIFSLRDVDVRFGKKEIFKGLNLNIHRGNLIALVGKNGVGKTTLMKIIMGTQEIDNGELWNYPGLKVTYFTQHFELDFSKSAEEEMSKVIANDDEKYKIDIYCDNLNLNKTAKIKNLSGGQKRRIALAKSLIPESDIILLDEPTNHLDLECIQWLEQHLKSLNRVMLCVSHDRTFLSNFTNKVFWLDRGDLKISPGGFKNFDTWSAELLDQEFRELRNRKQFVNLEVEWAQKGVKARVKRNVKRLERAKQLKDQLEKDESSYRLAIKTTKTMAIKPASDNSRFIAEFFKASIAYPNSKNKILKDISVKITKGDRIGLLGKNGTGKTTFLKTLIGELEALSGSIKLKKNLEFSYFDQLRNDLNTNKSLKEILVPNGGDYLSVQGKERHVCSYLKDFQFDPKRVNDTILSLSGGQQNRLLLSKVLANPKTGLILDEPTNDLDLETMDLLTEMLSNYKGTLLIVSHDRDFLDQTVNKILSFEGDGKIAMFLGGYSDFLNHQSGNLVINKTVKKKEVTNKVKKIDKLSFKFKFELEIIPQEIKSIEEEISSIKNELKDSNLYISNSDRFEEITEKLSFLEADLIKKEARWLELLEMEEAIKKEDE
ncbi:MAG: ABC-F family ATP-binding cassette domain-containing protein [Pelagibacteraceae bacterium]|jgi:ATP-binding cassette subfamily F protein uup|nr:ABC-F family ATP-binding cassette domain-containing protein [Pelagibacteraceae bacterium]MBT3902501.1 ABC-F family ATP-binding cassette domain-containing protein [Pelagibacteraceae bacterium]MBT4645895.1 ABC-F family ATP-binding cassette domain-containing protein [Pelagibacteraceae bacterium]MBT4952428.1 ABC-F family ATP-binding cassette domain-containing protein [Pelagibacteraceae bacterium]